MTGTHLFPPRDPQEQRLHVSVLSVENTVSHSVDTPGYLLNGPVNGNEGTAVHSKKVLAHRGPGRSWRIFHEFLTGGSEASSSPTPRTRGEATCWVRLRPLAWPSLGAPSFVLRPFLSLLCPCLLRPLTSLLIASSPSSPKGSETRVKAPRPHSGWLN